MKGLGTKESTLIRIIVSRCEIDMVQIKQKFEPMAKESLGKFLKVFTNRSNLIRRVLNFLNKFSFNKRAT